LQCIIEHLCHVERERQQARRAAPAARETYQRRICDKTCQVWQLGRGGVRTTNLAGLDHRYHRPSVRDAYQRFGPAVSTISFAPTVARHAQYPSFALKMTVIIVGETQRVTVTLSANGSKPVVPPPPRAKRISDSSSLHQRYLSRAEVHPCS